jgi:hypothetical protein
MVTPDRVPLRRDARRYLAEMSIASFLALVAAALLHAYGSTPHGDPELFLGGSGAFLAALGLSVSARWRRRATTRHATPAVPKVVPQAPNPAPHRTISLDE